MENVIVAKASQRAMTGWRVRNLSWALIGLVSFTVITYVFGFSSNHPAFPAPVMGAVVSAIVTFMCICGIVSSFYAACTVETIDKAGGKVSASCISFPFRRIEQERRFDRVIQADVEQDSFGTLLNTGSVSLKLITYANADTVESGWVIQHVNDPRGVAARILEGLPQYEGLKVVVGGQKEKAS